VTDLPDGVIVRRVLEGDPDAFGVLLSRYRDRMARFAVHMLGDRDEAEDALQEAFIRAYRSLRRCADPDRFDAWLFRIVVNRCRTAAARRARRARLVAGDAPAVGRAAAAPADPDGWREEIERALARLAPEQREAFLLKHVEELSYEEMARITGAGESALKMRVKRACERLRGLLRERQYV